MKRYWLTLSFSWFNPRTNKIIRKNPLKTGLQWHLLNLPSHRVCWQTRSLPQSHFAIHTDIRVIQYIVKTIANYTSTPQIPSKYIYIYFFFFIVWKISELCSERQAKWSRSFLGNLRSLPKTEIPTEGYRNQLHSKWFWVIWRFDEHKNRLTSHWEPICWHWNIKRSNWFGVRRVILHCTGIAEVRVRIPVQAWTFHAGLKNAMIKFIHHQESFSWM